MTTKTKSAAEPRLLKWIGWAGLDAVGRLALLTGSTIVLSRMLTPRDFGVTALVLTIVAAAAVFVGTPFEEALAQRRSLRMIHLRAALGASWIVGLALFLLSIPAAVLLSGVYGEAEIRYLLPVGVVSIFFSGHSDIVTALARRLRRFNDIAYATLIGHVIGIALALVVAFMGGGAWALIAQRLLVVVARAVILQWRIRFLVLPAWSGVHVLQLARFAGMTFADRLADNLTYLVFNNVVEAFYGITTLGYVNMASRIVEPIRGAIAATSHNVAFSFFARATRDNEKMRMLVERVVSQSSFAIAPVFFGMAAVTPVLLPLMAGPGWEEAIDIAVCLALGAAISTPSILVYTAFSARARPEYGFYATLASFLATLVVLICATTLGPISVGLSRVAGDIVKAAFAVILPDRSLAWSWAARFSALWPAWITSLLMAFAVYFYGGYVRPYGEFVDLAFMVIFGVAFYAVLLRVFARDAIGAIAGLLPGKTSAAAVAEI